MNEVQRRSLKLIAQATGTVEWDQDIPAEGTDGRTNLSPGPWQSQSFLAGSENFNRETSTESQSSGDSNTSVSNAMIPRLL